ncbi:MAG: Lon protease family protein [Pleomorphochaeta sp.]
MAEHKIKIKELSFDEASFSIKELPMDSIKLNEDEIIGQPRAIKALEMGLNVDRWGYNVFISGDSGTGRLSAVQAVASTQENDISKIKDIAYIHNFVNSDNPKALVLERGLGNKYKNELEIFNKNLKENLSNNRDNAIQIAINDINNIEKNFEDIRILEHLSLIKKDLKSITIETNKDITKRYNINLVIDSQFKKTRPFVIENHPSFITLFGAIDDTKEDLLPYQRIKAGSILESCGGILVLYAQELLQVEGLWDALKKYLDSNKLRLKNENYSQKGILKAKNIRAEVPKVPLKVVLIGNEDLYNKLSELDEQFLKHFKVSAQFDYAMDLNETNISFTLSYLEKFIKNNKTLPLDEFGKKAIIRYSAWFCEHRNELTTQFSQLTDLLVEANWWAQKQNKTIIDEQAIRKALEERDYTVSLIESKINQEIERGEMIISLTGSKVGIVNGLAVIDRGSASFGLPTVITATVAPGSEGIVNIEHEAGLSGEIHDKGLLILEGYLRKHYARTFPLSIYAGICFEQSYAEIDGDSASSSELYALLSAISEIPIRQDIAVTGSVNQMGIIQPVGGINEKIEGFYNACKKLGLTGRQGVIIPVQNVKNLILSYEVEEAIKNKKFHIYSVKNIDEGMQILTNRAIGERNQKGNFPIDTLNREIDDSLKELFKMISSSRT